MAAVLMLAGWVVAGCSMFSDAAPAPQACAQAYSVQRCLALTDAAAADAGRTGNDVTGIVIVPNPTPPDGMVTVHGAAAPINVRATFVDGSIHDALLCGGVAMEPACHD